MTGKERGDMIDRKMVLPDNGSVVTATGGTGMTVVRQVRRARRADEAPQTYRKMLSRKRAELDVARSRMERRVMEMRISMSPR